MGGDSEEEAPASVPRRPVPRGMVLSCPPSASRYATGFSWHESLDRKWKSGKKVQGCSIRSTGPKLQSVKRQLSRERVGDLCRTDQYEHLRAVCIAEYAPVTN